MFQALTLNPTDFDRDTPDADFVALGCRFEGIEAGSDRWYLAFGVRLEGGDFETYWFAIGAMGRGEPEYQCGWADQAAIDRAIADAVADQIDREGWESVHGDREPAPYCPCDRC